MGQKKREITFSLPGKISCRQRPPIENSAQKDSLLLLLLLPERGAPKLFSPPHRRKRQQQGHSLPAEPSIDQGPIQFFIARRCFLGARWKISPVSRNFSPPASFFSPTIWGGELGGKKNPPLAGENSWRSGERKRGACGDGASFLPFPPGIPGIKFCFFFFCPHPSFYVCGITKRGDDG